MKKKREKNCFGCLELKVGVYISCWRGEKEGLSEMEFAQASQT
jgi:hypothetical protein